jgi:hypothetical protein
MRKIDVLTASITNVSEVVLFGCISSCTKQLQLMNEREEENVDFQQDSWTPPCVLHPVRVEGVTLYLYTQNLARIIPRFS